MTTASRNEVKLMPKLLDGLAVLEGNSLVFRNAALLQLLSEPSEKPEVAGLARLDHLLADPEVQALLAEEGESSLEIQPDWWRGQAIALSVASFDGRRFLTVHNWTPVHRLATLQQDLVANVSHELRTPLTSIRMAAESLQLGAMASDKMRAKFLSNIQREADRLTRLINEILVVANLQGRTTLHLSNFTFPELANEVKMTLDPHADLNQVQLLLSCAEQMPVYCGDRDRIHQVLLNLVDNALKFTPALGTVALDIAFSDVEQAFKLKVSDTGIGIPEVDRPHIFDRFYRVDKSRSRVSGGVGLGLSIVKDIIVAHGGEIHVESELNQGTRFLITLPLHHGT